MDGLRTHTQAQRSLRYAWPKSERLLYSEPKKLVELDFATVHKEDSGNRTRNVYTITEEGRQALNEWTRTQPPRLEFEALLRVLFATFHIEMFKTIERWIEFARDGIEEWCVQPSRP